MNDFYYKNLGKRENSREPKKGYITDKEGSVYYLYMKQRSTLGILGVLLPLILIAGTYMSGNETILPSLSDYYYSKLRTVFTGLLIAIAMFLFFYHSDIFYEKLTAWVAGVNCLCVAFFPTPILDNYVILENVNYSAIHFRNFIIPSVSAPAYVGVLHFANAAVFFILLSFLVLKYFKSHERANENSKTKIAIYNICGWGILFSIVCIFFVPYFFSKYGEWIFPPTFTCESLALFLFGLAWLVKGRFDEIIEWKFKTELK